MSFPKAEERILVEWAFWSSWAKINHEELDKIIRIILITIQHIPAVVKKKEFVQNYSVRQ